LYEETAEMPWSNDITVADEKFHPRTDDPWWNESSFVSLRIPERELLLVLYFYFRPNQNTAMGGPWIVDPHGDDWATCNGFDWHMPIPEGADMYDFELESGLSVRTIGPQHSYRYGYTSEGCDFDLTFIADRPPVAMRADENVNMGDYIQDVNEVSVGHYEQTGVINGLLNVGGESIRVVDAAAIRDRTWGPRKLLAAQRKVRGCYIFARADTDNSFSLFAGTDVPWEDDPILGTTERITSGFYTEDGVMAQIVGGTRKVVERDELGRPMREVLDAVDELGRTFHAEGEIHCHLKWNTMFGGVVMYWCYEQWTINGKPAPGELQEWFMWQHFSTFMRAQSARSIRV
jgi:hypothetical protein